MKKELDWSITILVRTQPPVWFQAYFYTREAAEKALELITVRKWLTSNWPDNITFDDDLGCAIRLNPDDVVGVRLFNLQDGLRNVVQLRNLQLKEETKGALDLNRVTPPGYGGASH